jgi:hypothetical protein
MLRMTIYFVNDKHLMRAPSTVFYSKVKLILFYLYSFQDSFHISVYMEFFGISDDFLIQIVYINKYLLSKKYILSV